jgi:hypothetical protein
MSMTTADLRNKPDPERVIRAVREARFQLNREALVEQIESQNRYLSAARFLIDRILGSHEDTELEEDVLRLATSPGWKP